MSLYYTHTYTTPEPIYAKVKEKLRSYFSSKAIDDVMFPIWTFDALDKYGKSVKPIKEVCLSLDGYEATLPCDFHSVREVWATTEVLQCVPDPVAHYFIKNFRKEYIPAQDCEEECSDDRCETDSIMVDMPTEKEYNEILVMNKNTQAVVASYKKSFMLYPGNGQTLTHCGEGCVNINGEAADTFIIADGKIITNFSSGNLFLIYYARNEANEEGTYLIPDNYEFRAYLEALLTYKCLEQLSYQVTDETFSQIERKLAKAEMAMNEAAVDLRNRLKKRTQFQQIQSLKALRTRNNKFIIK